MAAFTVVLGGKPFRMELPLRKRPPGGVHLLMIWWNEAHAVGALVVDETELRATSEGVVERQVPKSKF